MQCGIRLDSKKKKKEEGGSGKTNEIQVNSVTSLIPSC